MEYAFLPNYLIILFFLRSFFMDVNFSCFVNWKTMRIQHEKDLDFYSTLLSVATSVPQEGMKDDHWINSNRVYTRKLICCIL